MKLTRPGLLLALFLVVPGCGNDRDGRRPTGAAVSPRFSGEPSVPPGTVPPVSLVWNIGFTENVSLAAMEAQYAKFVQLSQDLWTLTEGQVHLGQLRFFDAQAPGAAPSSAESLRVPALDVIVYSEAKWDIAPVTGQVLFFSPSGTLGRTDRRIDVPDNAHRLTLAHEGSHFVWRLSWSGNSLPPGLDDEYAYSPRDPACVMDLMFLPFRWCSGGSQPGANHVTKSGGQGAQSCWEQIRLDYSAFSYSGVNGTTSPLPAVAVEYNDTP
jgi:hypothetical protein